MTGKEAIEYFYRTMENGNIKNDTQQLAYETAIGALEKQIPKKVNNRALIALSFPAYLRGDCPVCGSKSLSSADTNYCNVCGQRLDFGELTEEEIVELNKKVWC